MSLFSRKKSRAIEEDPISDQINNSEKLKGVESLQETMPLSELDLAIADEHVTLDIGGPAENGQDNNLVSLAPRPLSVADTGIALPMLEDLFAKILLETGVSDLQFLTETSALSGPVAEEIVNSLRLDGRLEIRSPAGGSNGLRYALTDAGKKYAREAFERSGYIGPCPVPLEQYRSVVLRQSVHSHRVNRDQVHHAFSDLIIKSSILNQLGAAMHSGKAVFIYGSPGTGKTYACQRLARLLGEPVLIPHAVAVGDSVVRVFDNLLHRPVKKNPDEQTLLLSGTRDPRYELCERPFICSGGELSSELLEIQYDESSRQYRAPLQLKSNNGIYLIDDLGRQRMPTAELFNRWIVPMESGEDFLNMQSGNRMVVPFDLVLIFSTNLNPNDLADAAFLRRIGHKIKFDFLDAEDYSRIWKLVCSQRDTVFDQEIVDYVVTELHGKRDVPMLACHPRDLIGIAVDYLDYMKRPRKLDPETMHIAWDSNFVDFS